MVLQSHTASVSLQMDTSGQINPLLHMFHGSDAINVKIHEELLDITMSMRDHSFYCSISTAEVT
jgi:hypothetical protein